ncbi:hypothetical protein BHM03_00010434 [Ensete ventricosum]|uniref:Uncharacterized protein n=1 Tax=Ensete ventricosum TaxID=4639 RepID=A0A445MD27_ENSVE|nr:hypothetical protein BHM03_00010434 [Ensete ventricosum]
MVGSLGMVGLGLFLLLLEGPGGEPWDDLARGHFWSSHLPATNASHLEPKVLQDWLVLHLWCKGGPPVEFSPSSSFDLMNSLWTSSIHWFINCNCARNESVESQEMVFGLGMLQIEVLVVGVYHLVVFPTGAVRLRRRPREIIVGCCGVRHPSGLPGVGRQWGMPGVAEQAPIMPWSVRWQVPFFDEGKMGLSSHSGRLLGD